MKNSKQVKSPSKLGAIIPFFLLVFLIFLVVKCFGASALDGGSQTALIVVAGYVIFVSLFVYHRPWSELEAAISENIHNIGSAIIILLLIGAIGGSWMVSGIVPTLICYGLKIISPKLFLFAACFICALVAVMTGSSWTTIATLGVALVAIGSALGYSPAWSAGAIISGAYFGDKVSPLSDTTVLASSIAEVPIFEHIRYMMLTTGPAIILSLLAYLVVSLCHESADVGEIEQVTAILHTKFNISPWLLLVPALTGVMIWRRLPAILTLLSAALMAGVAALIAQPGIVAEIASSDKLDFLSAFKGLVTCYSGSTALQTGDAAVNELVSTSGMNGMLPTVFLIVSAATFGGTMVGSGMIQTITDMLTSRISSRGAIVGSTIFTGFLANIIMGDQYLSIILSSRLYKDLYKRNAYEKRLMSRSVEDSATITSVLIPWNSCGMTQATVLRVPTITYLPFCFFNILSPIISIIVALTGYKIYKTDKLS